MKTDIQTLLGTVADLRDRANVNAVFSEPVTVEGRTVISVAKIGYAFGLSGGHVQAAEKGEADSPGHGVAEQAGDQAKRDTEGSAGFGGVRACPMAVIEVTPEGTHVEPIVDEQKLSLAGAMLVGWCIYWLARALTRIFGQRE